MRASGRPSSNLNKPQERRSDLAVLLNGAILLVYVVLGILYESDIHPITTLSGLPSAAFGALVTLLIIGMDLNIYAFVGMIIKAV